MMEFWTSRTARVRIVDSDQSQKNSIIYGCSQSSGHAGPAAPRLEYRYCQLAGERAAFCRKGLGQTPDCKGSTIAYLNPWWEKIMVKL